MGGPEEILAAIPHRPPFLFADEVLEATEDSIATAFRLTGQEAFLAGHYPGRPLMPGALLCECVFQAGALLLARRLKAGVVAGRVPVLTRVKDARFHRPVRPGDLLRVEARLDETLGPAFFLSGRVLREGERVMSVSFACALAEVAP